MARPRSHKTSVGDASIDSQSTARGAAEAAPRAADNENNQQKGKNKHWTMATSWTMVAQIINPGRCDSDGKWSTW